GDEDRYRVRSPERAAAVSVVQLRDVDEDVLPAIPVEVGDVAGVGPRWAEGGEGEGAVASAPEDLEPRGDVELAVSVEVARGEARQASERGDQRRRAPAISGSPVGIAVGFAGRFERAVALAGHEVRVSTEVDDRVEVAVAVEVPGRGLQVH